MRDFFEEYGVIIALVGAILFALVILLLGLTVSPAEKQKMYSAWMKVYPQAKLSFDEWDILRRHELLPGQDHSGSDMAVGMAVGMAAGSAVRR